MLDPNPTQIRARSRALEARRVFDLAEGILVGLRRYSIEHAFEELATVARRHDMPVSAAAAALVDLASADTDNTETQSAETVATEAPWAQAVAMAEKSEATAIAEIEHRLESKYPDFPQHEVRRIVQTAHARFAQSTIRDFVPLFVERNAAERLNKLDRLES